MAESEYHAIVTVTAEGLGLQSLLSDLCLKAEVRAWTDSDAAEATMSRRGFREQGPSS